MNRKKVGEWAARIVAAVVVVLLTVIVVGLLVKAAQWVWAL